MTAHNLWYKQPASCFEEALPIGAGRFGAMLYGDPSCELLCLNEDSVWSGGKRSRINPDAKNALSRIRRLIQNGQIKEAETLAFQAMQGCPRDSRHYQPLVNLSVRQTLHSAQITDYRRQLSLDDALYSVSFKADGVPYRREVFASFPDQCIVIRLTAGVPFDAEISLDGRDDDFDENCVLNGALRFTGCTGGRDGIRFACIVQAECRSGTVSSYGNTLALKQTQEACIVCAMETSYYHPNSDPAAIASEITARALQKGRLSLLDAHFADYHALFDRISLELPHHTEYDPLPTDQLLQAARDGVLPCCNRLLELYFHYGRYLMIAGSREGSLPLNLQGIWNVDMWPAWGSRFTVNINTEMNYWLAGIADLAECELPLFSLLERIRENGTQTAREMYGCHGFCCHHNTDLWGDTAPQDLWMPATIWQTGGAWLSLHIMEHYRYSQDLEFLRKYYPILHDAALFFTDFLMENEAGQLVTCPSISPENTYLLPNGEKGSLCIGPSMDSEIITELYHDVIEAAEILGIAEPLTETLQQQLTHLPQPRIGQYGQIMEWAEDYAEAEPGHRHISQLFALHPARQISPRSTPELASAAAVTLHRRLTYGGGHTGWSAAWIANMFARLCNGGHAYEMLQKLMTNSTAPNLFDLHPPFQIDGNFGGASAIAECLLQSAKEGILLLPACPTAWDYGSFQGLCTHGGFRISAAWSEQRITHAEVRSAHGGICRIWAAGDFSITCENGCPITFRKEADGFMQFETVRGGVYHLTAN